MINGETVSQEILPFVACSAPWVITEIHRLQIPLRRCKIGCYRIYDGKRQKTNKESKQK